MSSRPPSRLPGGYREIWSAVADADREAGSRAELARRLGVSTHTLQRILVDGAVPDFRTRQSTRLVRSWARTLTRLARNLDREPRDWIEAVGIDWDASVRAASEAVERRLEETGAGRPASPGSDLRARIRARAARGDAHPVEAGLVDLRPFSVSLPGRGDSFFGSLLARLVRAVDPAWGLRVRTAVPAELAEALVRSDPAMSLAIGLFETAHLRGEGITFLPLPGWRLALRALWVGEPAAVRRAPSWPDLVSDRAGRLRLLVQEADPAHSLVRGSWGWSPERVLVRRRGSAEALARDLFEEARRGSPLALVADEETCRRARASLGALEGFRDGLAAREVVPAREEAPRYSLAVAVSTASGDWADLLRHAWDAELFGAAGADTARLYAEVMAEAARDPERGRDVVRPEHFEAATPDFQRVLCRHLVATLARDSGRETASQVARSLVPPEWRSVLDEVVGTLDLPAAGKAPPPHPYCDSCSIPLREYGGVAERYCRFCSDTDGTLKPRAEVQRLIAEWMREWQGNLSDSQSMERAERFMSTMPAWSN